MPSAISARSFNRSYKSFTSLVAIYRSTSRRSASLDVPPQFSMNSPSANVTAAHVIFAVVFRSGADCKADALIPLDRGPHVGHMDHCGHGSHRPHLRLVKIICLGVTWFNASAVRHFPAQTSVWDGVGGTTRLVAEAFLSATRLRD